MLSDTDATQNALLKNPQLLSRINSYLPPSNSFPRLLRVIQECYTFVTDRDLDNPSVLPGLLRMLRFQPPACPCLAASGQSAGDLLPRCAAARIASPVKHGIVN